MLMAPNHQIREIPFSNETFNKIPSLEESDQALQLAGTGTLVKLRKLLIDAKQNNRFGFSLLHRHFPLKQGQILVEMNNVTTPWTVIDDDITLLWWNGCSYYKTGIIYPTSWMVVNIDDEISLMPYEFAYEDGGDDIEYLEHSKNIKLAISLRNKQYEPFLTAIVAILKETGLQGHVALTLLPEVDVDGAVETTVGEANVLRLRGEHNVVSPRCPDCKHPHNIQASLFWPTGKDGKIPEKAKGSKCDSMDTCKCTVKDTEA